MTADKVQNSKTEESKAQSSEEQQVEAFRHSASVQWVANTFHLPVETTARGFEFINFAIIALAILIPLVRYVPRMMRGRREKITHEIDAARIATLDAQARLAVVEEKLSGLDVEIASIRAQVEREIVGDEARIKASIQEETARIVAAAEQEIAVAAAGAERDLRHFAADLAIESALRKLTLTPQADSALLAEFIQSDAGQAEVSR